MVTNGGDISPPPPPPPPPFTPPPEAAGTIAPDWMQLRRPPGANRNRPNLPSRPLSDDERNRLDRMQRSSSAASARWTAIITGVIVAGFSIIHFLGALYPEWFFAVLGGGMVTSAIAGSTAIALVKPVRDALRYGRAVEINGVPTRPSGVQGWLGRYFQMGPVEMLFPRKGRSLLTMNEMHRIVVAQGPTASHAPSLGQRRWPRALVLEIDGRPITDKEIVFLRW